MAFWLTVHDYEEDITDEKKIETKSHTNKTFF